MKKIIVGIFCLLILISSKTNVRADIIPQGEKGVSVCQKITNLKDYKDYNFYILGSIGSTKDSEVNDSMLLKENECLEYYKLSGAIIVGINKETNKRISTKSKLIGNYYTTKESDPIKSKEEYYKMSIDNFGINLNLIEGKNIFEDGTSKDYDLKDVDNRESILVNSFNNIIKIVVLFLSAGLVSLFSVLVYRKFINKK